MNYNDCLLADKKASFDISQSFFRTQEKRINELKEIIHKMNLQKADLIADNINGKYDTLIAKMNANITDLERIVNTNSKNTLNNQNISRKSNYRSLILSPDRLSPVRSREEMIAHGDYIPNNSNADIANPENDINQPNIPNNDDFSNNNTEFVDNNDDTNNSTPNQDENLGDNIINNPTTIDAPNNNGLPLDLVNNSDSLVSPPTSKTRTNNFRSRPLRSNFFANLAQKLNLNLFNNFNKLSTKKEYNVDSLSTQPPQNNRFHNVEILHFDCNHHEYLRSNQIDIIRLLILYLTICPTCRYHSLIAEITNCQFDIFLSL